jgi:hypothetical protein
VIQFLLDNGYGNTHIREIQSHTLCRIPGNHETAIQMLLTKEMDLIQHLLCAFLKNREQVKNVILAYMINVQNKVLILVSLIVIPSKGM